MTSTRRLHGLAVETRTKGQGLLTSFTSSHTIIAVITPRMFWRMSGHGFQALKEELGHNIISSLQYDRPSTCLYGSPVYGPPVYGPPVYGPPIYGPHVYGPPIYGPPVYGPPVYGPPVYGPPVYGPPVYGPPVYGPPVYGPPIYGPPVYGPPIYGPPIYGACCVMINKSADEQLLRHS